MGAVFWGSLDVQVSMYEGEQCVEALRVLENRIEVVLPNSPGGKYFKKSFGILSRLMLYGCGGSVGVARNMKVSSIMWWI